MQLFHRRASAVGTAWVLVAAALFGWGAPASAEGWKVGYVDLGDVLDRYEKTQAAEHMLKQKGEQKEAQMKAQVDELQRLAEQLELMEDRAREARIRQLEEKRDAVKRFRLNTARDLQSERNAILEQIGKEIDQAVQQYASSNGFAMIFDKRSLLYGQPAINVTDDIVNMLNTAYARRR